MKSKINRVITPIFLIIFSLMAVSPVHAVFVTPQGSCSDPSQIETAIGCISTSVDTTSGQDTFFGSIIKIAVGLGGGLALVLMLYGVFIVTTSAGIPDKLKEGQEVITSAISGLLFIILSVFLLNLIGINILGLPGLN